MFKQKQPVTLKLATAAVSHLKQKQASRAVASKTKTSGKATVVASNGATGGALGAALAVKAAEQLVALIQRKAPQIYNEVLKPYIQRLGNDVYNDREFRDKVKAIVAQKWDLLRGEADASGGWAKIKYRTKVKEIGIETRRVGADSLRRQAGFPPALRNQQAQVYDEQIGYEQDSEHGSDSDETDILDDDEPGEDSFDEDADEFADEHVDEVQVDEITDDVLGESLIDFNDLAINGVEEVEEEEAEVEEAEVEVEEEETEEAEEESEEEAEDVVEEEVDEEEEKQVEEEVDEAEAEVEGDAEVAAALAAPATTAGDLNKAQPHLQKTVGAVPTIKSTKKGWFHRHR